MAYVEKNRMNGKNVGAHLPAQQKKTLDDMSSTFLKIESRLRHIPLEASHGET